MRKLTKFYWKRRCGMSIREQAIDDLRASINKAEEELDDEQHVRKLLEDDIEAQLEKSDEAYELELDELKRAHDKILQGFRERGDDRIAAQNNAIEGTEAYLDDLREELAKLEAADE